MEAKSPFASVLVRSHNDEAFIRRTLEGIFAQKVAFPFEVVVCDDASTDLTREIAASFPVRFFERPAGPYKPGRTLNALVRDARGDVVVFNNSDAVPLDDRWLDSLVKPLLDEPSRPIFAFANQLPRQDAQALVRKDSERAFGDGKVQATWRFFFSLASSATWRRLLVETPFDEEIQYSEDVEWTWRNSRRAQHPVRIVYCPDAHVEHSHNYTLRELARRFKGEGAARSSGTAHRSYMNFSARRARRFATGHTSPRARATGKKSRWPQCEGLCRGFRTGGVCIIQQSHDHENPCLS